MLPVVYTPAAEKFFKKIKDQSLKKAFKKEVKLGLAPILDK